MDEERAIVQYYREEGGEYVLDRLVEWRIDQTHSQGYRSWDEYLTDDDDKLLLLTSPSQKHILLESTGRGMCSKMAGKIVDVSAIQQEIDQLNRARLEAAIRYGRGSTSSLHCSFLRIPCDPQIKGFTFIDENLYLVPKTTGEISSCNCEPQSGCGERCVNRLMHIECSKGTCPCGSACTNQHFDLKHNWPQTAPFRAGKKGYGLMALEDIAVGGFIASYVGEVIDGERMRKRMAKYEASGILDYYFLLLDKDLYIDARVKGNKARFVNHSCVPNARMEKWIVNGENRMGLFATRPIPKGGEISFNYQWEGSKVADMTCLCGEDRCIGVLGRVKTDQKDVEHIPTFDIIHRMMSFDYDGVVPVNRVKKRQPLFLKRNYRTVAKSRKKQYDLTLSKVITS